MSRRSGGSGESVFVDTHALVAVLNADDVSHRAAVAAFEEFAAAKRAVWTSDWVLAEFLCIASRPAMRVAAARIVERLQSSNLVGVIEADRRSWEEAFLLFKSRRDKGWSFIDCTSIVLCRVHSISDVLTGDHHFAQAGLNPLLRRFSR